MSEAILTGIFSGVLGSIFYREITFVVKMILMIPMCLVATVCLLVYDHAKSLRENPLINRYDPI